MNLFEIITLGLIKLVSFLKKPRHLAVLVIVFAWLNVTWANIALTVIGGLLVILEIVGTCCCQKKCDEKAEEKS